VEGFDVIGKQKHKSCAWVLAVGMLGAATAPTPLWGQAATVPGGTYQAKFPGDPARSESEAQALGYMRTMLRAQHVYEKRHGKYADSLTALAGTGSFTKRMAGTTDRGDYTASFRPRKEKDPPGFVLTMTPKRLDAEHRSFYAEEDGVIRADDQKAADADSPKIK
jgi:hypothetical protein